MMSSQTAQAKMSRETLRQNRNYEINLSLLNCNMIIGREVCVLRLTKWYGARTMLLGGGAIGKKGAMPEPQEQVNLAARRMS